jgi:hypothetical protein
VPARLLTRVPKQFSLDDVVEHREPLGGVAVARDDRYYLAALRGVLLKGNGDDALVGDIAALALWRFRRRLA